MKYFQLLCFSLLLIACGETSKKEINTVKSNNESILTKVDNAVSQLNQQISSYKNITSIDHHRMAAETGVYTPPSIATIFSNPEIDSDLISKNQLAALDLPFKVLCYTEPDTSSVKLAYTSAEFIEKRHGLNSTNVSDFRTGIETILKTFPNEIISNTNLNNVEEGFGIISIKSDFDHASTIQRLKDIILSQGDTKWFADIDFQKEASNLNIELRPTTLLLFGGPAPGGKAMMTSPKIGLDAFCQKLLVYKTNDDEVWIAYNDIVAFSELYYNKSTKPQQVINQRLKMTFNKAVKIQTPQ